MGLDFPVLLGLIAFLLNYVPTVGSIIAAIPALLLSLILVGTAGTRCWWSLGYVVVNTLFGNILEPSLMGRRLASRRSSSSSRCSSGDGPGVRSGRSSPCRSPWS
jgi:predicted PurR-regulated permease PerM